MGDKSAICLVGSAVRKERSSARATHEERLAVLLESVKDPQPQHRPVESRNVRLPGLWLRDLEPSVLALAVPPGPAGAHARALAQLQARLEARPQRGGEAPQPEEARHRYV